MKFSIAIPTYEMGGFGAKFLGKNLLSLAFQRFTDFEVVVSDHSLGDDVLNVCDIFSDKLKVIYSENIYKKGSSSANLNNAIKYCSGDWIKILFQDDFLYDENSLRNLSDFVDENPDSKWVASACQHTNDGRNMLFEHHPKWNADIRHGINTISSPSVIAFKNMWEENLRFNEDLLWLMDVDFYGRMFDKYGEPSYLNKITVVNRIWDGSISSKLSDSIKQKEVMDSLRSKNA